mgnify:CR=1 FL=1
MDCAESSSRFRATSDKRKRIKISDLPAAIDDELDYQSDSSDASWLDLLAQNSDKEHSDSESDSHVVVEREVLNAGENISNRKSAPVKWIPKLSFKELENFVSPTGVNHNLCVGSSEIEYFSLFVNQDFCDHIAKETNKYAIQCQSKKADSKWEETNGIEIQAYLGILIYMGMVDLPEIRDYFIDDFCVCPIVRQAMTLRRFEKISQYLHLNDEEIRPKIGEQNYDFLYKVRPALDIIKKYGHHYKPGRDLSVDEAMIGFKGRFNIKQYMPKKPTKWGIKAWGIADSKTGYLLNCKIYLGKKDNSENNDLLLGEQVVMNMCRDYTGLWHHVYFDNFFTSTRLMMLLLEKQTYACGTTRACRKDWPAEFRQPKKLKLKRGESRKLQHGDVTAIVWHDNRDVLLLSTNSDPREDDEVERNNGKGREKVKIPCPEAVVNYTKNMGGLDLADQMRDYYGVGRPSKKWWKYLFHFVINVSIVNSFIIYDISNRPAPTAHGARLLHFRRNLVLQLIGNFTSRKRTGWQRTLPTATAMPKTLHSLDKIQGRVKTCLQCKIKKRKTKSGRGIQTQYRCKQCDISLCRVGCFLTYHQERGVEIQN